MKNKLILIVTIGFSGLISVPSFAQTSNPATPSLHGHIMPVAAGKASAIKQSTPTQSVNAASSKQPIHGHIMPTTTGKPVMKQSSSVATSNNAASTAKQPVHGHIMPVAATTTSATPQNK